MITDLVVHRNVGLIATDKQFVLLIKGEIHGPFNVEDWKEIANVLKNKEEKENDPN